MKLTASRLRANIYRILDQVLETGEPVEIERRGRILRIVAVEPESWLDRIVPIPGLLLCDPDEIVHMDWSSEWNPDPT
jgi:antitoxin (DNA-binding transcriptional repressor) of toxin-antitoxin stability system